MGSYQLRSFLAARPVFAPCHWRRFGGGQGLAALPQGRYGERASRAFY